MRPSDPGRRRVLRNALAVAAATALAPAGTANAAAAADAAGPARRAWFPPVPGMRGDRRANEFWYRFDQDTIVRPSAELKEAYAALRANVDRVGQGSIADIWLKMVKSDEYPDNFTAFAAPVKQPLDVVSRTQLRVIDAFYDRGGPQLDAAFSWFGQGVLYDPRIKGAHTMNGDPPRGYHTWHAYLRAMMLHDIDRERWRELAPRVALAWATQSTARPDAKKENQPLPQETVRRLAAFWLPRTPETLDTDFQADPYPWSAGNGVS
ncbi:hypothetical protein ACH35V_29125 [Actinomadura sp. 1N219]|uniref:hypothetical protein n=1 Tax=Actinomadura sp. 1N219 TaxID=3375152 RepID=UPI0037A6A9AE